MKNVKPYLLYTFIIGTLCTKAFSANPDDDCCEPSISGQPWEPSYSQSFTLDPVVSKIVDILKFIPGGVKPNLKGSISLAHFSKTGCCSPRDENQTSLIKSEFSGSAGVGLDTGKLPIPGVSLPLGMGGGYISASTSVDVSLSGSGEGNCSNPKGEELIVKGDVSQTITLGGGITTLGDYAAAGVEGSAQIGGGVELSAKSGWKANKLTGSAKADFIIFIDEHEWFRVNIVGT
jgi:hypothetical protein